MAKRRPAKKRKVATKRKAAKRPAKRRSAKPARKKAAAKGSLWEETGKTVVLSFKEVLGDIEEALALDKLTEEK